MDIKRQAKESAQLALSGLAFLCLLMVFSLQFLSPALAAPMAGQPVNNQASATFFDTVSGRNEKLDSNVVSTSVARQVSFTLTQSQNLASAQGANVRFQHAITNNGNSAESFNLLLQDNYSGTYSFTGVQLFADANNDGVADSINPLTQTPSLAPGQIFQFLAIAQVPATATTGQEDRFTIIAAPILGGAPQQTNVDTVTITNNAVIVVSKGFSVSAGPSPNSDIFVTLNYSNIGNSTANNVVITDVIGAPNVAPAYDTSGMQYVADSASWQGVAVTDAAGGDVAGINYSASTVGTNPSAVTTVTAAINSVPVGGSGTVRFKVDVKSGLAPGIAKTTNAAAVTYFDGISTQTGATNNTTYYRVVADGPDLVLTKRSSGSFSVGVNGRYILRVSNIGAGPTVGRITVTDVLPTGLTIDRATLPNSGADGWACSVVGNTVSCDTSTLIPPGQEAVNPLVLTVKPESSLAGIQITNNAEVSGGGEAPGSPATTNNLASDTLVVGASASVAGYAWFDLNHNNIRDANEPPGINMIVEIINNSGVIVARALTGQDGAYFVPNLAPGAGYKIVFRYPDGSTPVASTPINGELGQPNPTSNGVVTKGTITGLTLSPGLSVVRQNLRLDPSGVVYDSVTRLPVTGAIVRLEGPAGFNPAEHLVGGVGNVEQTTGASGIYQYILLEGAPAGIYRLGVTSPAAYTPGTSQVLTPAPSLNCGVVACLDPTDLAPRGGVFSVQPANIYTAPIQGQDTTYYLAFFLDVATDPEIVNNHIPLDPILITRPGLLVEKTVNRPSAEIGDAVLFTVRVRNSSKSTFPQVQVTDNFPFGFKYVAGSARLDGQPMPDPVRDSASSFRFVGLGDLLVDANRVLTYVAILSPGSQQGDGINRAFARSGSSLSNTAIAKVAVTGGVFTTRGIVLGKLYVDCNHNHVQDPEELGIPGVRFYLQDGTYIITDSEGKFSFAGLSPRTHVLKIDRTTLPKDAKLTSISNRNALDGQSRFIDLKNGELHRADFAEFSCSPSVVAEVKSRRTKGEVFSIEIDRAFQLKLDAEGKLIAPTDRKALPASGLIDSASLPLPAPLGLPIAPQTAITAVVLQPQQPAAAESLQDRLSQLDNALAILDFQEGDTLPFAQTNLRIKGVLGANLKLTVNGQEVPNARVGIKSEIAEKQLQYREYIGVPLVAGRNTVVLDQLDEFGNFRGSQRVVLIAPDKPGRIEMVLPALGAAIADGFTPVKITVRITDSSGVLVTARTPITLETSLGRWRVVDANPNEPGIQTFIKGGSAEFDLMPPLEPLDAILRVSSGVLKTDTRLPFIPELRPLIGAGVLEGVLNLRNMRAGGIAPARARDGFEQELRHFSKETSDGKTLAAARAAFFLKGKVKGEYLLTMAYDSDKELRERLFRDIRPDEFYPVYGDSSIKGFDAQSTSRLYVRVDKLKSYLLWGDYSTVNFNPAQRLTQYQRALTGVKHHYENNGVVIDSFASRDTTRQVVKEVPANGTSGPFELNLASVLTNSERIELLTRDRNQPALIIRTSVLTRFVDYAFEPLSGRLLLRAPLASVDQFLNPNSIRVSVEIDQGGSPFWVAGTSASVRLTNALTVGANIVRNLNPIPENFSRMTGANLMYQFGERSVLTAELANTLKANGTSGNAERIEFNHDGDQVKIRATAGKSSVGFDNPASILRPGREEIAARAAYTVKPGVVVAAEVLHTKDVATGAHREGILLNVEKALGTAAKIEVGVRHVIEEVPNATFTSAAGTAAITAPALSNIPSKTDLTSIRVKATTQVPGLPLANVYGEVEQDLKDTQKRLAAVGGEYQFAGRGKLYARHEFQSSLQGAFALNNVQRTNVTVLGVSSEYMTNGTLFSEYRGRDSFGVRTTEAAVGLRNVFAVADGLRFNTNVERIKSLSGSKDQQSEALGLGLDYTGSQLWKGSTRVEMRDATTSRSYLQTADAALKISRNWTMLGRHIWNDLETKSTSTTVASERILQRLRIGAAYRDTDTNRFDALAMIEKKRETDSAAAAISASRNVWIGSAHFNYQPQRAVVINGQVAAKNAQEIVGGMPTSSRTSLVAARVTWDFTERWDVSAVASTLMNHHTHVAQKGLGVELGYLLTSNAWLSMGYNIFGYRDRDLAPTSQTDKGVFVRLRFKFDEDSFKRRHDEPNGLKEDKNAHQ
jgi:large repetitive protein